MRKFLILITAMTLSSIALAVDLPKADSSWEKISDDEGVLVHRKEIPGSPVVAFRGETIIDAPIAKVSNVLIDTSRKLEWVAKIVEAKDIRQLGTYERIEYNHTASGNFLVRDRDFVFHAKAILDKANGRVTFQMKSVEDPLMPETDKVRGYIDNSSYVLTSLENGTKTHVVVEIHADPKGSVPKWLVNLFQKSWPRKTLLGIKNQCAKPDVVEHAGIKAYFAAPAVAETEQKPVPVSAVAKKRARRK